jgi:RNA polymerase sigma-70 factor, ECF subfamily
MKTDPDVKLMLAYANGDEKAFRELFARHHKRVINFCYRFCLDRGVAEELAQEVFIRVYQAAGRYRPDARFSTWLYRIAVNLCLNESRKRKYKVSIESMDQPVYAGDSESVRDIGDQEALSSHEMVEAGEREKLIQQAMKALPEEQKAALLLRVFNEFSYEEIADQMTITEAKVKSLIYKGRKRLQDLLAGYFKNGSTS